MEKFVGVAGFEPAASCSQSRRDNRATLHPVAFLFVDIICGLPHFQSGRDNQATLHPKTKKAESKGFEPLVQFPIRMFSKHVLSATQATLQIQYIV